jgi:hypothetical protein
LLRWRIVPGGRTILLVLPILIIHIIPILISALGRISPGFLPLVSIAALLVSGLRFVLVRSLLLAIPAVVCPVVVALMGEHDPRNRPQQQEPA